MNERTPFDLQRALDGDELITRDGILATDFKAQSRGEYQFTLYGNTILTCDENGVCWGFRNRDLFMAHPQNLFKVGDEVVAYFGKEKTSPGVVVLVDEQLDQPVRVRVGRFLYAYHLNGVWNNESIRHKPKVVKVRVRINKYGNPIAFREDQYEAHREETYLSDSIEVEVPLRPGSTSSN